MLINTYKINNTESTTITIMKFILLLGVVLIHSSISQYVMEIPHLSLIHISEPTRPY